MEIPLECYVSLDYVETLRESLKSLGIEHKICHYYIDRKSRIEHLILTLYSDDDLTLFKLTIMSYKTDKKIFISETKNK